MATDAGHDLSKAGLSTRGEGLWKEGGMREMLNKIFDNPYSKTNPDGFINIGVAENYMMIDEVAEFANKHVHLKGSNIDYAEGPWGKTAMRKAMAKFMNSHFNPHGPIKPHEILFSTGCSSIFEMLGFAIAEPGDGLLLGRPMYQAFKPDFGLRAKLEVVPVSFHGEDPFTLDAVKHYEGEFDRSQQAGQRIRALLLCTPHNPLGRCFPADVLVAYMKLCNKLKIHLILDEIYALSVYDVPSSPSIEDLTLEPGYANVNTRTPIPFTSGLALDWQQHIDPAYFHVLYGFSKDFACGGIRLGMVWSKNAALIRALSSMSIANWPGNLDETLGIAMLSHDDGKWIDGFLDTGRKRLAHGSHVAKGLLKELGIPFTDGANAGFFLWLDLRKWLRKAQGSTGPMPTASGEQNADDASGKTPEDAGWEAERELSKAMLEGGVFLTAGEQMLAEEPGYFRVCFVKTEEEIKTGLKRLKKVLDDAHSA